MRSVILYVLFISLNSHNSSETKYKKRNDISLPFIDIQPWISFNEFNDESRKLVSQNWDDLLSNYGFCVIQGHGVPSQDMIKLRNEARAFFQSSLDEKRFHAHSSTYGHPSGGYTGIGTESVSGSVGENNTRAPDNVESFVFTRKPDLYRAPNRQNIILFPSANKFYLSMENLLHILHKISAKALYLEDLDFFDKFYPTIDDKELYSDPNKRSFGTLRLAFYPPSPTTTASSHAEDSASRYGAHTDYQGFTILSPDPDDWRHHGNGGLEVLLRCPDDGFDESCAEPGVWIPVNTSSSQAFLGKTCEGVESDDGGVTCEEVGNKDEEWPLVVLAADLIQRWTNDRWKSVLHRVSSPAPLAPAATKSRISLVFFSGPTGNVTISTIPSLGPSKYEPIGSLDHLLLKLQRGNSNHNPARQTNHTDA